MKTNIFVNLFLYGLTSRPPVAKRMTHESQEDSLGYCRLNRIFQSDHPITSLADCNAGIFYASTHNAGYFNDEGHTFVFYNSGVSKLMAYHDTLYVLDATGRFYKIMGTNYFKTLTESLTP